MPSPGLSLVGFMEQADALDHLRTACLPANSSDANLISEWQAAKGLLNGAWPNAGHPDIQPMPAQLVPEIDKLLTIHGQTLSQLFPGITRDWFKLVEVDPLLAFQFTINTGRSQDHCGGIKTTELADLLPICLPENWSIEPYHWQLQQQSVLLKSRSLNLRIFQQGINGQVAGISFWSGLPFVSVARLNGRCYLSNGYHRAFGVRGAGFTHVPCLVRDCTDPAEIGIAAHATFDLSLLESDNPPTVGHFTQGRAHPVTLRATSRIMHVSWAEYAVYDE